MRQRTNMLKGSLKFGDPLLELDLLAGFIAKLYTHFVLIHDVLQIHLSKAYTLQCLVAVRRKTVAIWRTSDFIWYILWKAVTGNLAKNVSFGQENSGVWFRFSWLYCEKKNAHVSPSDDPKTPLAGLGKFKPGLACNFTKKFQKPFFVSFCQFWLFLPLGGFSKRTRLYHAQPHM